MSNKDVFFKIPESQSAIPSGWYKYICEYFDVTQQEAIKLGTRAPGRKPSLPGSETCQPISGKTHEDLWDMRDRSTPEGVFQFYIDQGAWSTFRQTVRHTDPHCRHVQKNIASLAEMAYGRKGGEINVCEYGSGIAPYSRVVLETARVKGKLNMYFSDVDKSEHFLYSSWMLQRIVDEREINATINPVPIKFNELPKYDRKMDLVVCFEVMEHVLSPVAALNNLMDQMNPGCFFAENFIKHDHDDDDDDGPDLASARNERQEYYNILNENFTLMTSNPEHTYPNQTRVWAKK